MTLCPHCGADFTAGVNAACRDCRLAPDPASEPTLPPSEEGEDELAFEMGTWAPAERVAVAVALDDEGIPWRWEAGPLLVVRELDEAVVEALLDDFSDEDEGLEAGWGDGESAETDEAAQTAMGDMFLVADRLLHSPWNGELVAEMTRLVGVVEESPPPFGIDRNMWQELGTRARSVTTAAEEADEVAIEDGARALRDFLREYV